MKFSFEKKSLKILISEFLQLYFSNQNPSFYDVWLITHFWIFANLLQQVGTSASVLFDLADYLKFSKRKLFVNSYNKNGFYVRLCNLCRIIWLLIINILSLEEIWPKPNLFFIRGKSYIRLLAPLREEAQGMSDSYPHGGTALARSRKATETPLDSIHGAIPRT